MHPRHHAPSLASARRTPLMRIVVLVLTLLLGLTASALVHAGSAGATVPRRTDREQQLDRAILHMINRERAAHDRHRLNMAPKLQLSARRHNVTMARFNEMSHQLPGEPVITTRFINAGYNWSWAGENIAWNSDMSLAGATLLERLMYHEKPPNDEHRLNILSTHYRGVGVDVYMDRENHKVWLTTDFGRHM